MSDYVQPIGEADPNAPYKDRNTGGGEPGSRVPALAIEMPQREIRTVIVAAGLTPDKTDPTQLNDAIDQKIALATGGGSNPLNDLLDLLRARLRIFPETLTGDGKLSLSVPSAGNVRVPAGINILHRGVFIVTTAQQDFATAANKTYHLRYRFTGTPGWALVDLANPAYNPASLSEASASFDTSLDDMLAARVITDAANVATITSLVNKHDLNLNELLSPTSSASPSAGTWLHTFSSVYDWARRPTTWGFYPATGYSSGAATDNDYNVREAAASESDLATLGAAWDITRYRLSQKVMYDDAATARMHWSARA